MGFWLVGAIISRSVTSCAGMTAYLALLAQTRVGFRQWGRREKYFHQLPPQEQAAQREEAYARATVALTRAQQICFIMGPLDMRGLVGAATIIGCLKYGACFQWARRRGRPCFSFMRLKDVSAKLTVLLCESEWSLSTSGPGGSLHY